jgi:protein-disulfide isomerase-like protein with CxxC motif
MQTDMNRRRRPVEAIEQRTRRSLECEQRVRKALAKLAKTGVPFTVENVCNLAAVGKTFIYDKRHPELTKTVLAARDASQGNTTRRAELHLDENTSSWRERALNAEALAKTLRATVKDRDARITDLTGQLYDPDGTHLADENARLRDLITTLNANLQRAQLEINNLRRSLDAARANVKRERERNVMHLFAGGSDHS